MVLHGKQWKSLGMNGDILCDMGLLHRILNVKIQI